MKLGFYGAAGTVTGSKYLVSAGSRDLLVDCGLFQGYKQLRERNWAPLPFDAARLDAVVLTHAHLDHTGYLPLLVKHGFRGSIVCTEATSELCRILLPDSGRIQEEDAERANRRRYTKHAPALPLYTEADSLRALEYFKPAPFNTPVTSVPGVTVYFEPAGHILGSAIVRLTDGAQSLVFTGDLGRPNDPLMRPPGSVTDADYLVIESTYGNRRHDPADPHRQLGEVIDRVARRGGCVIIPSFAVGRTQSLLWCLHRLKAEARIPSSLPVYLNSPMATDVTQVYHRHRSEHRLSVEECAGMCGAAKIINSVEESKALNERVGPMVIIAGSGMATGGRVVHHLKEFAPDPKNAVVFAGFQAGGTRGAAMLHGAETVRIHGEQVPVRAEVVSLSNLSAHADYVEMLGWLRNFRAPPKCTFITHGEPDAADGMRLHLKEALGWHCRVPEYLERVELEQADADD